MKFITNIFIFILISLTFSSANASDYSSLFQSHTFHINKSYRINNIDINFHGRSTSDFDTTQLVIQRVILLFGEYYSGAKQCRPLELNVYEMPDSILNNRESMSFLNWSLWNNSNIYGTYDSRASPGGTAAIFVSRDVGEAKLEETIAHEMSHFWQDMHCLPIAEEDAKRFERYYIANR